MILVLLEIGLRGCQLCDFAWNELQPVVAESYSN